MEDIKPSRVLSPRVTQMKSKSVSSFLALSLALCLAPGMAMADAEKGFACAFEAGTTSTYAAGKFDTRQSAALRFEISGIDLEAQTARLMGREGAEPGVLRVVRALNANHFIEAAAEGFLNLTTIYDRDTSTGTFPAVHSRHFGLFGQPVVAQYTGTCRSK